ncbi:MAG: acylneuraminate cytidylyltransferase [Bdellovibrio sp.]|jgi:hypothetical protein
MKLIIAAAVIALAFTTGFTCSKNAPTTEAPVATEAPAMPAEGAPPVEAAPAAPADGQTPPATTN